MLRSFAKGTRRRETKGEKERREAKRRNGEKRRQIKREGDGKEKDAWSGQDRRANGGHRTEMASGSAFQYSTLATLGHPTSSVLSSPLFLFFSILGVSLLLLVPAPHPFALPLFLSSFLSVSLPFSLCPSVSPARLFLLYRSSSSFFAAISSLSDRSSASSFGLRVLLFRSSAFLSFRSLADSSEELSSLRRHCGRIHSADFIECISLCLSLFLANSPRPLMDLSILRLLFD